MSSNENWRSEIFLHEAVEAFSNKKIVVAGCGADGSHAVEAIGALMARSENASLLLADPDTYDFANVGIQVVSGEQIGVNKARATAQTLHNKLPQIHIDVCEDGITYENITTLLDGTDYVVDATDISVTDVASALHSEASKRGIPVVVPWSLGFGGAIVATHNDSDFNNWGTEASRLANELELPELAGVARWLVHIPDGLTLAYLRKLIVGEAPTPTTYFGAVTGGHLAAKWIYAHAIEKSPPVYDTVVVTKSELLNAQTQTINCIAAIEKSLKKLKEG